MASTRLASVLFVCLGNICRSPLAEGVMRAKAKQAGLENRFFLDSCGTGAWHVGHPPDRRSVSVGMRHGVDLSDLRARKLVREDFHAFDLILAMDQNNLEDLKLMRPRDGVAEVALYLDYCGLESGLDITEVPDPYYGGTDGFETVYRLIDRASSLLIQKLLNNAVKQQ